MSSNEHDFKPIPLEFFRCAANTPPVSRRQTGDGLEKAACRQYKPRIFIAGIMQGSRIEKSLHGQDYREKIADILRTAFVSADIYDPRAAHKNSPDYSNETGRETFLRHNRQCGSSVDLLVAYLPEASMGTAIEMWEGWKNGAKIVSISPMDRNWAVKFLSHRIYPDMAAFEQAAQNGELNQLLESAPGETR